MITKEMVLESASGVNKVVGELKHRYREEPPKLRIRKVINDMLEKMKAKNGNKKSEYQAAILQLEKESEAMGGSRITYTWESLEASKAVKED